MYQVEREAKDLATQQRQIMKRAQATPIAEALHKWMLAHRETVPEGTGTAGTLDYSLNRWTALPRYLDGGAVPIDLSLEARMPLRGDQPRGRLASQGLNLSSSGRQTVADRGRISRDKT